MLDVADDSVVFQANPIDDATQLHVWRWDGDGLHAIADMSGVHTAAVGGPTTVLRSATLDRAGATTTVHTGSPNAPDGGHGDGGITIESFVEHPLVSPNLEIVHVG